MDKAGSVAATHDTLYHISMGKAGHVKVSVGSSIPESRFRRVALWVMT